MTSDGVTSAALGADHPAVELTQTAEEEIGGSNEETVYTSAISELTNSVFIRAGESLSSLPQATWFPSINIIAKCTKIWLAMTSVHLKKLVGHVSCCTNFNLDNSIITQ